MIIVEIQKLREELPTIFELCSSVVILCCWLRALSDAFVVVNLYLFLGAFPLFGIARFLPGNGIGRFAAPGRNKA